MVVSGDAVRYLFFQPAVSCQLKPWVTRHRAVVAACEARVVQGACWLSALLQLAPMPPISAQNMPAAQ